MKSNIAIAALVVATIGLGAALPVVAQDASATPAAVKATVTGGDHQMQPMRDQGMGREMGPGGFLLLACTDEGAAKLEQMLDRTAKRLVLTADQQALFDTFRTTALTSETTFADACKTARPAPAADTRPDPLALLKGQVAIEEARLTALNAVLPSFEAFYNSLNDQQKLDLLPPHDRMGDFAQRDGNGDRMGRPPQPGRP